MKKIFLFLIATIFFVNVVDSSSKVVRITGNGQSNGGGQADTYRDVHKNTTSPTDYISCAGPGGTTCPLSFVGHPDEVQVEQAMDYAKNQIATCNLVGLIFFSSPIEKNVRWNKSETNTTLIKVWSLTESEPTYP